MRLRQIFLITGIILIAGANAQVSVCDTAKVSLELKETSFTEIVNILESVSPVYFYFDEEDSALANLKYTGVFHDQSIKSVLNRMLDGIAYSSVFLSPNNIIIVPGTYTTGSISGQVTYADQIVIGNKHDRGKFRTATLSGIITDGATGTPHVGAVIFDEISGKGAVSDINGHYSITLEPGKRNIRYSSVGYETSEKEVELISSGNLDISLFEESVAINEVVVTQKRPDKNVSQTQMGTVELSAKEIKHIPSLMGEADLIKSLLLMPGVQTVGEAAAGFNIRGGNIDQNLILVDGTSIFNTSHLFGFFSTIHPEVINGVTLYKGNIPAKYGGRISSVMDIGIKESQVKKVSLNAGIGLINTRINTQIPIIKDKVSLVAGARSTYSDWMLRMIDSPELKNSSAGYYDIIGKLKWQIDRKNSFSVFAYQSSDRFNFSNTSVYNYGNRLGNLKYHHIFSNQLSVSLFAGTSNYKLNIDSENYAEDPNSKSISSSIQQLNSKLNVTYIPFQGNMLDIGVDINRTSISPGHEVPLSEFSSIKSNAMETEQAVEAAVYLSDNYDITSWLGLNLGFRYSYYRYLGPKSVFSYDPDISKSPESITDTLHFTNNEIIQNYHHPEPRVSLRINLDNNSSLKIGYNHSLQYIQLLSNTSAATPTDIWKLADQHIKPLLSDQFSLGYFRNFFDNSLETSVELYYKKMANLIDYKNGAVIIMNEHIESDVVSGSGKAYGVEIMLRKSSGRLSGWVGYTFSRTLKKTVSIFKEDLINRGEYYPAPYDKPHDLSSSLNYSISRRWSISANFIYSTGRPATLPEYQFEVNGRKLVYFSDRNKYRLPDYHRLDMSITYHGHIKAEQKYRSSWTLSLYNLYGRSNPYSVYYTKDQPTAANDYKDYVLYKLSIVNRPIPTISYNFKF